MVSFANKRLLPLKKGILIIANAFEREMMGNENSGDTFHRNSNGRMMRMMTTTRRSLKRDEDAARITTETTTREAEKNEEKRRRGKGLEDEKRRTWTARTSVGRIARR